MGGTRGAPATPPHARPGTGDAESPLPVSIVLVAGLTLVHLVMAASLGSVARTVIDLVEPVFGAEPALLAATMIPAVPLVLVVVIWTVDQRLGAVAGALVLAVSTLPYLRGVVAEALLDPGDRSTATSFLDVTGWLLTALVPLGAALGWSLARRRGTSWWPGLLVAPVVAVALRWLDLDPFAGDDQLRSAYFAMSRQVLPAVLAGLACWWLEYRQARS